MKRFTLILIAILSSFSLFAQSADLQPIATVNLIRTEPITVKQLKTDVERMEKSAGRALTQSERTQILDLLINERLVLQAAERDRVIVTDNEINQQIQQLRNQLQQQVGRAPTDAEFSQVILTQYGLDITAFKDQLRRQMIFQKYLSQKKGDKIDSVAQPTDSEVLAFFNSSRNRFVRNDTIRFSMILVPFGVDAASRTEARKLADSLVKEINNDPKKYDEVAEKSAAPNSGYQAGDSKEWGLGNGYVPSTPEVKQMLGQDFVDVAFSLKQGQVSRVIEGQQGYLIIKVTENYSAKMLELTDIIQLGAKGTVKEFIVKGLSNEKQQAALAQASQELVSELRTGKTFRYEGCGKCADCKSTDPVNHLKCSVIVNKLKW